MRTVIRVVPAAASGRVSSHARYISERERNPEREEPESRPIFTHDRDGIKHKAADRYLAGGVRPKARSNELHHLVVSFNKPDWLELARLEPTRAKRAKKEASKTSVAEAKKSNRVERSQEQVERDLPYARVVRLMMQNLEEHSGLMDFRYAMAVHRHTQQTHVHLLLRRECADRATGEKRELVRLPKEFLNSRDEVGKARGGLLDVSLSDALDTMIPRRQRKTDAVIHSKSSLLSETESSPEKSKEQELSAPEEPKKGRLEKIKPLNFSRKHRRAGRAEATPDALDKPSYISKEQIPVTDKEGGNLDSSKRLNPLPAKGEFQPEDLTRFQDFKSGEKLKDRTFRSSGDMESRAEGQLLPDRAIDKSTHGRAEAESRYRAKNLTEAEYRAAIEKEIKERRQAIDRVHNQQLSEHLRSKTASSHERTVKNNDRPYRTGRGR